MLTQDTHYILTPSFAAKNVAQGGIKSSERPRCTHTDKGFQRKLGMKLGVTKQPVKPTPALQQKWPSCKPRRSLAELETQMMKVRGEEPK